MRRAAYRLLLTTVLGLTLAACGGGDDVATGSHAGGGEAAPDITAEKLAYYRDNPDFFRFRSIEDLPADLEWQDGSELPDLGSPEAKKGGTFYYFVQDFPRTLRLVGPDSNGSFRPWVLDYVRPWLARPHPSGEGFYPELAEAFAIDADNSTVYVKLDRNARWSDGEPVTADDYLFMFFFMHSEYIVAPWYNNWYSTQYTNITRYDDYTISITRPVKRPDFAYQALWLSPMPEHFFKELGPDYVERYQWRFVPTTGPYVIHDEDIRKGRSITLTRLDDWWAKDKKFQRNRFNADRIRMTVIRDRAKQTEAFKRGDIDLLRLNTSDLWYEQLPDTDPLVQNGYIHKATFYNVVPRAPYGLWINLAKPLLDDPNIREGIHHASNWQLVIDKFFRGDYGRLRTTADGYAGVTHPTLQPREFDVDKAQEYFARAGFTQRGPDGVLVNAQGQRLSFNLSTGYQTLADVLTILKEEALKAGLEFRLEVLDNTAGFKKAREKKHDIHLVAFNYSPEKYPRYWETYHSANAYDQAFLDDGSVNPDRQVKTQTNNLSNVADLEVDRLIEQYRAGTTHETLVETSHRLEERLDEIASWVPGFKQDNERSGHWRWVRFPEHFNERDAGYVWRYHQFWIDEEARAATRQAMKDGGSFPPSVTVYDRYKQD